MLQQQKREFPEDTVQQASSIEVALTMIKERDVIAVTTPVTKEFQAACAEYEHFARIQQISETSECLYRDESAIQKRFIGLVVHGKLVGGESQEEPGVQERLDALFLNTGFSSENKPAADTIVAEALRHRRRLADMYPGENLGVVTEALFGGTVTIPHLHNDIALGVTVCGPTTCIITKEAAEKLEFQAEYFTPNSSLMIARATNFNPKEMTGVSSVVRNQLVVFKGAREAGVFSAKDNLGAAHFSPTTHDLLEANIKVPRLYIVSFVHPPDWRGMRLPSRG